MVEPSIASVTGADQLGTVTAKTIGSTTIAADAGGITFSIPLTVNAYAAAEVLPSQSLERQREGRLRNEHSACQYILQRS